MPTVRITNGELLRGEQRIPLFMGELHYWRLNPARWPAVLASIRRLGLDTVATYVPWQYHETAPGQFDFDGITEPTRNLIGFLDLLAAQRFHCFIRPGPYIYCEWTNAGVPDRVALLPRISEAYRAEALVWMRAVTDVLRPYFATSEDRFRQGGPIILFQPDNEVDLFSHWFENQCGLDGSSRPRFGLPLSASGRFFQDFLRETYPDIAALNDAWQSSHASFDDCQPAATPLDRRDPGALARARDYWRFQHWATRRIVEWHAREYRAMGVDLPTLANYYPGGDVQNWRELSRSGVDFLGIDWYPRNEFTGPPPPPGRAGATGGGGIFGLPPHREHRVFLDSCRLQRAVSPIPFIAELECGVWHGYHEYTGPFSPNHYRLLLCSALLAGIRGFNWYMLVGRDNWYFTPINERGDLRPELAEVFLDLHRVVRDLDPSTLQGLTDVAAFFDCEQIATDDLLGNNPVLQALYDAQLDYDAIDAEALPDPPRHAALFYAAADWLPAHKQEALSRYVSSGGSLVLFQTFPRADERFRPHNGLDIRTPDRVLSHLGKKIEVSLSPNGAPGAEPFRGTTEGSVWVWDQVPPGAAPITATQIAGKQQAIENADVWMRSYIGTQWTVGYRQQRGAGQIIVLGVPPSAELVRAAAASLRGRDGPRTVTPGIQSALFTRRSTGAAILIAATLSQCPLHLELRGGPWRAGVARDLFSGLEHPVGAGTAVLPIPRASGGVWELPRA